MRRENQNCHSESIRKNSDFVKPQRPHGRLFFEAVMQTLQILLIK